MVQNVFTAAEIAAALHRSKQSVLDSLRSTLPVGTRMVSGNETRVWSKEALSHSILTALEDVAARRKTSLDALLALPRPFWRPRCMLNEVCQEAIECASLLQRALAPA